VPCVDRVHAPGAGFEQRAREAAGRGADVQGHAATHVDRERRERGAELDLAAQRARLEELHARACPHERPRVPDREAVREDASLAD